MDDVFFPLFIHQYSERNDLMGFFDKKENNNGYTDLSGMRNNRNYSSAPNTDQYGYYQDPAVFNPQAYNGTFETGISLSDFTRNVYLRMFIGLIITFGIGLIAVLNPEKVINIIGDNFAAFLVICGIEVILVFILGFFIQKMSQFRTRGIFEIPEREYCILSKLFTKIVKKIESDIDYESALNLIILSQTYYRIKEGKKEYLQIQIMNNALFKTKKFWEMYANYSITKAVSSCVISENAEDKEIEESFSNIVFAQLLPITDNMIDFGLDINIVERIIVPFINQYKIGPELAITITSVIEAKKLEAQEKNKNDKNINKDIEKKE